MIQRLHRSGFTIIELLVVLTIMAILASMGYVGMRETLEWARVQRSAWSFLQTTDQAKILAASTGRVHHITFNNAKSDIVPVTVDLGGNSTAYYSSGAYSSSVLGKGYNAPATPPTGAYTYTPFTPAPYWSGEREDNWYALMAPWKSNDGRWWMARGGMPAWNSNADKNCIDPEGRPFGSKQATENRGGCFGHALDADGRLPADQRTNSNVVREAEAIWDPYNIQVGGRRYLERGTRWMIRSDNPEWDYHGRNFAWLTANFITVNCAKVTTGRANGTNEGTMTTGYNFYPSGLIDRNYANVEAFLPCGQGFDQTSRGFVGIVSSRTKAAVYKMWDRNINPNTSAAFSDVPYDRPIAQLFITFWSQGDVVIGRQPALTR